MADEKKQQPENPLEDLAAQASGGLNQESVNVADTSKDHVQGGQIHMKNSAARLIEASALQMEDSAAAVIRAGSVEVEDSAIAVLFGREVEIRSATVSTVVGRQVQAEGVSAFLLVAAKAEGNIRAMLTPMTAAAFGAGFAAALFGLNALVRRLRSARSGPKDAEK